MGADLSVNSVTEEAKLFTELSKHFVAGYGWTQ